MKRSAILVLPALAFALWATLHVKAAPPVDEPHFITTLIDAGIGVGPLKIGDSSDRAMQLFPKKSIDQEWEDQCGTTYDWTDSANPMGHGDVFIRSKKGKIFQIESATTRFQTPEGITTFDPPDKVEAAYKDMRAYVLLTHPNAMLGDRPPIFWIDKKKGIAFEFAFDRPHHKRYVYKVIVFAPNKEFCPEQEKMSSNNWQPLRSYAIEPPADLSPESQ